MRRSGRRIKNPPDLSVGSVNAFGRAAVVTERDERVKGLRLITEHYGYGEYPVERCVGFEKTCVVRITVTEITAKRNLAGDNVIVPADPGWKRP